MRIKSPRTSEYVHHYLLTFTYDTNRLLSFECDKDGKVDVSALSPVGAMNYTQARYGEVIAQAQRQYRVGADGEYEYAPGCTQMVTYKVTDCEVRDFGKWMHTPAVGECNRCGADVHLHGFTNTCECGADYNMSGQELAPREQWGEETGETVADILAADTDVYVEEECPPTVRSQPHPTWPAPRPISVDMA
jgi:hypothetical protein